MHPDRYWSFRKSRQAFVRAPRGPRETEFRHVVGENGIDVIEFRRCDGGLGVRNVHRIRNAGVEALAGKIQRLLRDIQVLPGDFHLARGRRQIQKRVADVAFHPAFRVFEFGAALGQCGVRLLDIAFRASALPDRDAKRSGTP